MEELIQRPDFYKMHNETHAQCATQVNGLVVEHGTTKVSSPALVQPFQDALNAELEQLDTPRGRPLTEEVHEADLQRDNDLRCLVLMLKVEQRGSDPLKIKAARKLLKIIASYGNIPQRLYQDETAAISDLLREVRLPGNLPYTVTLGLTAQLARLEASNNAFDALDVARSNSSLREPVNIRPFRAATDRSMGRVLAGVEAMILLFGEEKNPECVKFIADCNKLFRRYDDILEREEARREARRNKLPDEENPGEKLPEEETPAEDLPTEDFPGEADKN